MSISSESISTKNTINQRMNNLLGISQKDRNYYLEERRKHMQGAMRNLAGPLHQSAYSMYHLRSQCSSAKLKKVLTEAMDKMNKLVSLTEQCLKQDKMEYKHLMSIYNWTRCHENIHQIFSQIDTSAQEQLIELLTDWTYQIKILARFMEKINAEFHKRNLCQVLYQSDIYEQQKEKEELKNQKRQKKRLLQQKKQKKRLEKDRKERQRLHILVNKCKMIKRSNSSISRLH